MWDGEGYIPALEELESAVPVARSVDDWLPPENGVSEELYGWVILGKKEWKPCMRSPPMDGFSNTQLLRMIWRRS